jgi:hypothetical protein
MAAAIAAVDWGRYNGELPGLATRPFLCLSRLPVIDSTPV